MILSQYEFIKSYIKDGEEYLYRKGVSCTNCNCLCGGEYDFCPFGSDTESEPMDCT